MLWIEKLVSIIILFTVSTQNVCAEMVRNI